MLTSGEQGYERVRARWGKVAQANRLHSIYNPQSGILLGVAVLLGMALDAGEQP